MPLFMFGFVGGSLGLFLGLAKEIPAVVAFGGVCVVGFIVGIVLFFMVTTVQIPRAESEWFQAGSNAVDAVIPTFRQQLAGAVHLSHTVTKTDNTKNILFTVQLIGNALTLPAQVPSLNSEYLPPHAQFASAQQQQQQPANTLMVGPSAGSTGAPAGHTQFCNSCAAPLTFPPGLDSMFCPMCAAPQQRMGALAAAASAPQLAEPLSAAPPSYVDAVHK